VAVAFTVLASVPLSGAAGTTSSVQTSATIYWKPAALSIRYHRPENTKLWYNNGQAVHIDQPVCTSPFYTVDLEPGRSGKSGRLAWTDFRVSAPAGRTGPYLCTVVAHLGSGSLSTTLTVYVDL
jgi:hypothetical protein